MIYKLILTFRDLHYKGGKHSTKADVPTICVGNISTGGTGKTPHTELILRELLSDGRYSSPAVLSRGYKRKSRGFRIVEPEGPATLYGDEPLQIKRTFPAVTVAVDKDRVRACRLLSDPSRTAEIKKYQGPEFPASDIIVLDDAFQYRKLKADLDIVLTAYPHPVTTDKLLPAGHLRDLKKRLYTADAVVVSKCPYVLNDSEKEEHAKLLGFDSYDPATCVATKGGRSLKLLFSHTVYGRPEPVFPEGDPRYIYSSKIVLVSGIADDTPLRNYLSDKYKIVAHLKFPDHHTFSSADLRSFSGTLRHNPTATFITTRKDATRLQDIKDFPAQLKDRFFYIPITAEMLCEGEQKVFDNLILNI